MHHLLEDDMFVGRRAGAMSLLSWIGGSKEPWRKLIGDHVVEALDEDSGELIDIKPTQDDPNHVEGLLISFGYVDAADKRSKRMVLCRRCWSANRATYLQGYCVMRKALRTFRLDRMTDVIEVRNKRVIRDPAAYFEHFVEDEGDQAAGAGASPISSKWAPPTRAELAADALRRRRNYRARDACMAGLRILSYLALADDVVSDAERNIQESFIEARLAMAGFDRDPALTASLMAIVEALAVPGGSFTRSLNIVAKEEAYFRLVADAARQMAASAGQINTIEADGLSRLLALGNAEGWV
jgi:hypothetical protein